MSENKNVNVQAWTTEDSNAVVWGTHDIDEAKKVYRELVLDTEPDWETALQKWGRPGLDEEEIWNSEDTSDAQKEDNWVPFLVFDF